MNNEDLKVLLDILQDIEEIVTRLSGLPQPTPTKTPALSSSPRPTPTVTATPTRTPTPTPTRTPTPSPSRTPIVIGGPPPVVFDTDSEADPDDLNCLAYLIAMHRAGKINLVGVTVGSIWDGSAPVVRAVLKRYGLGHLPVGSILRTEMKQSYAEDVWIYPTRDKFAPGQKATDGSFLHPAVFYRQLLVKYNNLNIVQGGFVTSIAALLDSGPDGISNLNGVDLVRQNGTKLWSVGGRLAWEPSYETNFSFAPRATKTFFDKWPNPVVFMLLPFDFETSMGIAVKVNPGLDPNTDPLKFLWNKSATPTTVYLMDGSPIPFKYLNDKGERVSGDILMAIHAVDVLTGYKSKFYTLSKPGHFLNFNVNDPKPLWYYNDNAKHHHIVRARSLADIHNHAQTTLNNLWP